MGESNDSMEEGGRGKIYTYPALYMYFDNYSVPELGVLKTAVFDTRSPVLFGVLNLPG